MEESFRNSCDSIISNIITNTRLPISNTIIITDTTPSPAEQPSDDEDGHNDKQNDGHDVGDDDGRLVNNTIEDDCEVEHSLGTEKIALREVIITCIQGITCNCH